MQKLLVKGRRGLQRRLFLLYPPKRNRKLQASIDLVRSNQFHSPLPVKELPPNPKGTNEFYNVQKPHINSSGANADPHNTMV